MPDGRSKVPRVVGDFLLIVVGVLAALAADSWMDRSRDAFLERRYLAELSRALTSDTSEIRASIAHSTQRTADAGKVLHVLRGSGSVGDVGEFVVAVYLAGQFNIPESETAVFDELLSSGRLLLLQDVDLRRELIAYYRRVDHPVNERWRNTIWYRYRPIAAQALSLEAQRWADRVLYGGASPETVPDNVVRSTDATIQHLRSVPGIEGLLREVILAGAAQADFWTSRHESATGLISTMNPVVSDAR
jgi:hypothetical protein